MNLIFWLFSSWSEFSQILSRSEPVQQFEKLKDYVELITTEKKQASNPADKIFLA